MPYLPNPTPRRKYCSRHGIEYDGYLCPECRGKMEREESDRLIKKTKKTEQDRIFQKLLNSVFNSKGQELEQKETNTEPTSSEDSAEPDIYVSPVNYEKGKGTREKKEAVKNKSKKASNYKVQNWLIALLLIFALCVIGLGVSLFVGIFIPFWILFGFSVVYSIEKWFYYFTRTNKGIGSLYRLILNLSILSVLGLLIWSGGKLFSQQFIYSPLVGSLLFLAEFIFFIWMWKVVARNSRRRPSMKLTVFSLLAITTIFAFAGVQPISAYKDDLVGKWSSYWVEQTARTEERLAQAEIEEQAKQQKIAEDKAKIAVSNPIPATLTPKIISIPSPTVPSPVITPTPVPKIIPVIPITPIPTLKDPTWNELKAFLLKDDTDKMPYIYPTRVCEDFAKQLQKNAQYAGWRCAVVSMRVTGYNDPFNFGIPSNTGHACNAFKTTDRGLVYIDCTGPVGGKGPLHQDRIASIEIGEKQINKFIFPTEWETVNNSSIVTNIDIRW